MLSCALPWLSASATRILNRFTKDVHYMDDLLPLTIFDFVVCVFMVLGGVAIVLIVNPWVMIR